MSVIVLGTVALDDVKTPFGKRENLLGGSAAHFSMSARLFTKVSIVAVVGRDFPQSNISFLKGKGLDLSSLSIREGRTFHWSGEYKGNDLNTAITLKTELGVLSSFRPSIVKVQQGVPYLFLANLDPDIQRHLMKIMRLPKIVALDSMNYWIDTKRKSLLRLLKDVDIYCANDKEAMSLSCEDSLIKAAKALHKIGPRMILIKKGEHGVLFYNGRYFFSLPAYPAERVVDPTGAGDTFAGGFMGYLARAGKVNDKIIKDALAYGTIAASFNIEGFGLEVSSKLKMRDIDKRLASFRKYASF
jgi:sugar/nucleoside kinase (ribokinase family)